MILLFWMVLINFFLVGLLKIVSFLISESQTLLREESSSYECGFEHNNVSRLPFSLRYFFLTLVFLLFDLEIVLMLFVCYFSLSTFVFFSYFVLLVFLVVFFIGLLYEWNDGCLDWVN